MALAPSARPVHRRYYYHGRTQADNHLSQESEVIKSAPRSYSGVASPKTTRRKNPASTASVISGVTAWGSKA